MKTLVKILFLFLFAFSASAASQRITATITVTNTPAFPNTVTVNGNVRTWTNSITGSPSTTFLIGSDRLVSATNMANGISVTKYGGMSSTFQNGSNIVLLGDVDQAMAITFSGTFASLTLSTQVVTTMTGVRVPVSGEPTASQRTNITSLLLTALQDYPTNTMTQTAIGWTNFLGTTNLQTISVGQKTWLNTNLFTNSQWMDGIASNITLVLAKGTITNASLLNVQLTNGSLDGFNLGKMTNGYFTNSILGNPTFTNAVNYGLPFSSRGAGGSLSESYGSSSEATASFATSLGWFAVSYAQYGTAIGAASKAYTLGSTAIGASAQVDTNSGYGTALGYNAQVLNASNSMAFGKNAIVQNTTNSIVIGVGASINKLTNSMAIGNGAAGIAHNQIMLGGAGINTYVQNILTVAGATTNLTIAGTNVWNGSLAFKSTANAILANGDNVPFPLGTNVFTRLSGATTIANLQGFTEEPDGAFHIIKITGSITNRIYNELGGAPAAQRINTGTGGDLISTNSPTWLEVIYDATAARWNVLSIR